MIGSRNVSHPGLGTSRPIRLKSLESASIEWCPHCGGNVRPREPFAFGNVAISEAGTIVFDGNEIDLPRTLLSMADSIIRGRGRGLTRAILATRLENDVFDDTIKKYVERLRACFRAIDPRFDQIEAIHGFGAYRWRFRPVGPIAPSGRRTLRVDDCAAFAAD